MTDRLTTDRIAVEKRREARWFSRPILWLFFRALERWYMGREDVLFEGGAVRKRNSKDKSWGPPMGEIAQPKYPRHPLCALSPVASAVTPSTPATRIEAQDDEDTWCWEVPLTSSAFQPEVWREIVGGVQTLTSIRAMLWIDRDLRVNRLAFEASRDSESGSALWSVTELWDFGIDTPEMLNQGISD
jgi:hypothetical protein